MFRYTEEELTSTVRLSTMANLKAEFHEHLTRPGVLHDEEMSICSLESDLIMGKSHANLVSFDENVSICRALKVTKLTSWITFRMTRAVIKCFEKSTVERIEENSNDVSRCLFIR